MKLFEPRGSQNQQPREQHFPGQAPIESYGNGGFRFADMSHRGSILCLPSGIHGWSAAVPADLTLEAFGAVLAEAEAIDILLIGTGRDMVLLAPPVRKALREAGISPDPMSTGAAIRLYNILLGERRKVAAALIAVE